MVAHHPESRHHAALPPLDGLVASSGFNPETLTSSPPELDEKRRAIEEIDHALIEGQLADLRFEVRTLEQSRAFWRSRYYRERLRMIALQAEFEVRKWTESIGGGEPDR